MVSILQYSTVQHLSNVRVQANTEQGLRFVRCGIALHTQRNRASASWRERLIRQLYGRSVVWCLTCGFYAPESVRKVASKTLNSLLDADCDPAEAARLYGARMADWMSLSGFRDGCPIATVVLEMAPQDGAIAAAATQAFDDWRATFTSALEAKGLAPERAAGLALLAVTSIEGALILARAKASTEPILQASEAIAQAFETALAAV